MLVWLKRYEVQVAWAGAVLTAALCGCSGPGATPTQTRPSVTAAPAPAATAISAPSPSSSRVSITQARTLPRGLTKADVQAGLLSAKFRSSGSGTLVTVPGNISAPSGKGALVRVQVQVEKGLKVNGLRFAAFAMNTLNDPRSWAHGGARHFARVDEGDFDIRIVLASPRTSARMCRPLQTFGRLSCHSGDAAVMTMYRWVQAIPDYGKDRTGYRHYLVNHEVGHALGHDHQYCPGKGRIAPVMQQQTKSLQGCRVNPWPFP